MSKTSNEWPKMHYSISNPGYIVCENAEQVPEGYTDNMEETDWEFTGEIPKAFGVQVQIDNDLRVEDTTAPTLKSLELTREEAIEVLTEEGIKFKKNASNGTLAALVAEALKE